MPAKGRVLAYAYIIEFQKRGLSYVHILIILHSKNRFFTIAEIDVTINTEIPNKRLYPNLYIIINRYILYNNCSHYAISKIGIISLYWDSDKSAYSKGFLKDFYDYIVFKPDFEYSKYRHYRSITALENNFK